MVLLQPFSNIDSTKLGCTQVEFGWQLGWSMLHVNCRQLIKFFFAVKRLHVLSNNQEEFMGFLLPVEFLAHCDTCEMSLLVP